MKKYAKYGMILALCLAVLLAFAACTNDTPAPPADPDPPEGDAPAATPAPPPPDGVEPVTITYMFWVMKRNKQLSKKHSTDSTQSILTSTLSHGR